MPTKTTALISHAPKTVPKNTLMLPRDAPDGDRRQRRCHQHPDDGADEPRDTRDDDAHSPSDHEDDCAQQQRVIQDATENTR